MILSVWYAKNKSEAFIIFIPLVLAVFILGSDRINMMAYFAFLYYALQCKRGLNIGILVTTVYFAWKSYFFVSDIIEYGNGFENVLNQIYTIAPSIYV
jgi:hypothetical protein